MTIPRMQDDPEDDFERAVLRSASFDGPSDGATARGIAALLAAATTGAVVSNAAAATVVAATADGITRTTIGAKALLVPAVVKWLGIGVVAGAVTAGVAQVQVTSEHATSTPVAPVAPAAARTALRAGQQPVASPVVDPSPAAPPASEEVSVHAERAPARAGQGAASRAARVVDTPPPAAASVGRLGDVAAAPSIGAELAALEQARAALRERRSGDVLRALAAYDSLRRPHVLEAEATMLRVEALVQSGARSEAARLAAAQLRAHPDSAHAARLREIAFEQKP